MSATQGSKEAQEAIGHFTETLRGRIGADRFDLWFATKARFAVETRGDGGPVMVIQCDGDFVAQRIQKNFTTELRASAMIALGETATFRLDCPTVPATSRDERSSHESDDKSCVAASDAMSHDRAHADSDAAPGKRRRGDRSAGPRRTRQHALGMSELMAQVATSPGEPSPKTARSSQSRSGSAHSKSAHSKTAMRSPAISSARRDGTSDPANSTTDVFATEAGVIGGRTLDSFLTGDCNEFAFSAAMMALSNPEVASPLFLHGPTGTGKSHLLAAMADALRTRRRMRRVILLTAEQFTNDFVSSVGTTGLPSFRQRYRDVDALLIDDVHFLASKTATLREALYTVETLTNAGKPLIFSANLPPSEIRGLTGEVAGRMSSGLVCPLMPLDAVTRLALLRRVTSQRCVMTCGDELLNEVAELLPGDGRCIAGVANMILMLQRMYRREPTIHEVRKYGCELLQSQTVTPTLRGIERAVCEAFGLEPEGLRGKAQTRRVSEPRTLAMYLARQLTGCAFTEIAKHFGRRSHTGAIAAQAKVETWLASGKPIGGESALTAHDAITRIEAKLRAV